MRLRIGVSDRIVSVSPFIPRRRHMQDKSIRVMNMVRRTLLENPDVPDRVLYAAAVSLESSIGDLSLKQFQARYPQHVRRFELGPRPIRRSESDADSKHSAAERPDLYAPGRDTLLPEAHSVKESLHAALAAEQPQLHPVAAFRSVRRRAGNGTAEASPVETSQQTLAAPQPEDESAPAHSDVAPESPPLAPWPLRLLPATGNREPPKRPRIRRGSTQRRPDLRLESGRDLAAESHASAGSAAQPQASAPRHANAANGSASPAGTKPSRAGSSSRIVPEEHQLLQLRADIRRVLLDWARELASAETRGELVGVLTQLDAYVHAVSNAWTVAVESTRDVKVRDLRRRTGSAETNSAESKLATPPARPPIRRGKRIQAYSSDELDALTLWILSNDPGSTDDAVFDAIFSELRFKRRGRRISAVLRSSIERVRTRT
jgi:hypothetical protein